MREMLEERLSRFELLETQMSDPEVVTNSNRLVAVAREHGSLAKLATKYRRFKEICDEIDGVREMVRRRIRHRRHVQGRLIDLDRCQYRRNGCRVGSIDSQEWSGAGTVLGDVRHGAANSGERTSANVGDRRSPPRTYSYDKTAKKINANMTSVTSPTPTRNRRTP